MHKIDEKIGENIAKHIDFRTLVHIYMCQHPESTKASIAERLGMSPITMTRAIAAGKQGVSESLVPGVFELMSELDFSDFSKKFIFIRMMTEEQNRYERISHLKKIVVNYMKCDLSELIDHNIMLFYLDGKIGERKYFGEILGEKVNHMGIIQRFDTIFRTPGNDEVFLFYYDEKTFSKLLSTVRKIGRFNSTHKITLVQVDLEKEKIISEYILYDPEKKFVSLHDFFESDKDYNYEDEEE